MKFPIYGKIKSVPNHQPDMRSGANETTSFNTTNIPLVLGVSPLSVARFTGFLAVKFPLDLQWLIDPDEHPLTSVHFRSKYLPQIYHGYHRIYLVS